GGDHDFIIPPEAGEEVLDTLFAVCSERACSFLLNRKKSSKVKAVLYDNSTRASTVLEFWTCLEVGNDPAVARRIEWEKIEPYVTSDNDGYFLDISFEALYYLSHLLTKRKRLDEGSVGRRVEYYRVHEGVEAPVRELYAELAGSRDIAAVGRKANELMKLRGILDAGRGMPAGFRKLGKIPRRLGEVFFRKNGVNHIMTVLGPDGVGKTAVIDGIEENLGDKVSTYRFKNYYRSAILYRLLYPVVKGYIERRDNKTYKRNQIEEMFSYQLYLLSVIRYRLNIGRFFTRRIQLTDRYFFDYILSGSRLNHGEIRRHPAWRKMLAMVPRTLAVIQVDADNEIIHSRRSEISSEHMDAFRAEYFFLSMRSRSNFYVYLHNGGPIQDTIDTIMTIIKRMKIVELRK
ncbi:MAG: hypothetical protein SVR04_06855, partial [Spirochaetota bacterium]|nr:hypothetical protein [Spirochaetota bacterium]